MDYRKLHKLSSIFFGIIVAVGGLYGFLVSWLFMSTTPGMVMYLVYLLDSIKSGYSLGSVGDLHQVMISSVLWVLSIILIWRFVAAIASTFNLVVRTRQFIGSLKIVRIEPNKIIFNSVLGEIFTAGLLKPKIFVASGLSKLHTSREIEAMISHEERHVRSRDPLRTTVVSLLGKATPYFPLKEKIIRDFYILVEICADKSAEEKIEDKLPVITALYKRMGMEKGFISMGINYFNSQSERIAVLVGKKILSNKLTLGVLGVVAASLVFFVLAASRTELYTCPHLAECIANLGRIKVLH